jgi:hypothetical protein
MPADPFPITLLVCETLERLRIAYLVCGSVAGRVHGQSRETNDVDILANIQAKHARPLAQALVPHFDLQLADIQEALEHAQMYQNDPNRDPRHRPSIKAAHRTLPWRIDIFVPLGEEFDRSQLARRRRVELSADQSRAIYVATTEDTILAKIRWYSWAPIATSRQWDDVLALLAMHGRQLDLQYLRRWAANLSIADLLGIALQGQRPPPPDDAAQQLLLF